jgi:hypothetical protein
VFDVNAIGVRKLSGFDVRATSAGGTAIFRSFRVTVKNGSLKLDFTPEKGEAMVSTITATRRQ